MMPLLISLLIVAVIFTVVSTGFCAAFKGIEGYWPRWHFRLFLAWWWPFRSESAATLVALAMDADPDAWKAAGQGNSGGGRAVASESLNARVSEGWLDHGMSLLVASKSAPLTMWDDYTLACAFERWQGRRLEAERKSATLEAAATFASAFRAKYGDAK